MATLIMIVNYNRKTFIVEATKLHLFKNLSSSQKAQTHLDNTEATSSPALPPVAVTEAGNGPKKKFTLVILTFTVVKFMADTNLEKQMINPLFNTTVL
jgi:hypothetical protein